MPIMLLKLPIILKLCSKIFVVHWQSVYCTEAWQKQKYNLLEMITAHGENTLSAAAEDGWISKMSVKSVSRIEANLLFSLI